MRATVDNVISQLASLESAVNNTADSRTILMNIEQNDILQQALKNSGLPNKNEIISKGKFFIYLLFMLDKDEINTRYKNEKK